VLLPRPAEAPPEDIPQARQELERTLSEDKKRQEGRQAEKKNKQKTNRQSGHREQTRKTAVL
jgi:hypothetical protein